MPSDKKKPRRVKGEGCISQRKDGTWSGYLTLPNGKRKWVYRKTKGAVSKELAKLRGKQLDGKSLDVERMTFGEYLDSWIEYTMRPQWKPSTLRRNRSLIDTHVKPHLGSVKLVKITDTHLDALQTTLKDAEVSERQRAKVHGVIRQALDHAMKRGKISGNPAEFSNRPKIREPEPTTFNEAQLRAFHKAVSSNEHEALYLLAALTGMRQGEILGLKWQDVNFDRGTISVKRALIEADDRKEELGEPKTESSKRTIEPHGLAMQALERHRKRTDATSGEDLVFPWKGGTMPPRRLRHRFKAILKKAGLPDIRFHDLRHSAATLLMEAGEHPKVVQELLGHANVSTTLQTYSHASANRTAQASGKLGAMLETADRS